MTVKSDSAHDGDKELKEDWPITEGLILGTTKLAKEASVKIEGLEHKGQTYYSDVPLRWREDF